MPLDRHFNDHEDAPHGATQRSARAVFLVLLVFVLVALFVLWRVEGDRADRIQTALIDTFMPVIEFSQQPGDLLVDIGSTMTRITRAAQTHDSLELARRKLTEWQTRAKKLELENAALKKIVEFVDTHDIAVITAPIIADTSSPFRNSLLVNAGTENGVENGWMATDGIGVVGHVTSVGPTIARIILIQDATSRIPAKLPASGVRVLAVGNNSNLLEMVVLEGSGEIIEGDQVVTSGDAGVFFPNYLIGTVLLTDDDEIRILPAASFSALRYVSLTKESLPPHDTLRSAIVGDRVSIPIP